MTKAKKFIAAAAAALALASSPAFALTAPEALQTMQAHGFYGVKDFDREHGYWTAKALSKEGVRRSTSSGRWRSAATQVQPVSAARAFRRSARRAVATTSHP